MLQFALNPTGVRKDHSLNFLVLLTMKISDFIIHPPTMLLLIPADVIETTH